MNFNISGEGVEYWEYDYALLNRLIKVRKNGTMVTEYGYDPEGLRVVKRAKSDTIQFITSLRERNRSSRTQDRDIPKDNGKKMRKLGIPTVSDLVTQMMGKMYLEPMVEPIFHHDYICLNPRKEEVFQWINELGGKEFCLLGLDLILFLSSSPSLFGSLF